MIHPMESAELQSILQGYAAQLPRYTSYPTAAHFGAVTEETYRAWLGAIPPQARASLYLHVPFCQKLCYFCGCHTRITQRYAPLLPYMDALLAEMQLVAAATQRLEISHVHFGGGSPSMLAPEDFTRLMEALRTHFSLTPDAEIAIEIDPRGLNEAKVAAYAQAGVNRISLGVQDFEPAVQHAINRVQPFALVYDAVQMLRYYGITAINFDFIYGLPKQTVASMEKTIDLALLLNPSRIAFYGYAHVPHKKKNISLIDEATIPDTLTRLEIYKHSANKFVENDFVPVGLDHFIHPHDPMAIAHKNRTLARNFQGYSTDDSPYLIGLGASAIGRLPQGYAQNVASVDEYKSAIGAGRFATRRGVAVDAEDALRAALIQDVMCYLETDIHARCAQHGLSPTLFTQALQQLQPLIQQGVVTLTHGHLTIRPDAQQVARIVCAAFDRYLAPQAQGFAQVA